jgi:division protein CdvB (Snf7/Vps24/ESCRT-III family)
MTFLKDLGKKISEGVQDATEKASELVEITKLKSSISRENDAINETKKQIGEKIFAMFKTGQSLPEVITEDLKNIDTRLQTITDIEAKIAEIKTAEKEEKA